MSSPTRPAYRAVNGCELCGGGLEFEARVNPISLLWPRLGWTYACSKCVSARIDEIAALPWGVLPADCYPE